jgi:adenylate kinase
MSSETRQRKPGTQVILLAAGLVVGFVGVVLLLLGSWATAPTSFKLPGMNIDISTISVALVVTFLGFGLAVTVLALSVMRARGQAAERRTVMKGGSSSLDIILLGAQGIGKSTQAELLSRRFDLKSLASGDLLRDAIERNTPSGTAARHYYDRGELVPDDIILTMITEHFDQLEGKRGIVLDGFPRTSAQADALDGALALRGRQVNGVIYLDAPREFLLERLSARYICKAHGHIWNVRTLPPKVPGICDLDGSPLYQRGDDSGEAVQKRLDIFFRETVHLVEYYETRGKLFRIDGSKSAQEVSEAVADALVSRGITPVR